MLHKQRGEGGNQSDRQELDGGMPETTHPSNHLERNLQALDRRIGIRSQGNKEKKENCLSKKGPPDADWRIPKGSGALLRKTGCNICTVLPIPRRKEGEEKVLEKEKGCKKPLIYLHTGATFGTMTTHSPLIAGRGERGRKIHRTNFGGKKEPFSLRRKKEEPANSRSPRGFVCAKGVAVRPTIATRRSVNIDFLREPGFGERKRSNLARGDAPPPHVDYEISLPLQKKKRRNGRQRTKGMNVGVQS